MLILLLAVGASAWSYAQGGEDWPETCKTGNEQSPIDIDTGDTSDLGSDYFMKVYYYGKTASRTVANDGNVIYIEGDFGYITVEDKDENERKFLTNKIEFHMPSEHFFDGYPSKMEMQIFHTIDDSDFTVDFPKKAVVSVMIRPGDPSYFMDSIEVSNLPTSNQNNTLPSDSNVNLLAIVDPDDKYFFYFGSMNKPDCEENVLWYVFETEQWVSFEQMKNFENLLVLDSSDPDSTGNVRSIQSLNGRTVYYSSGLCLGLSVMFLILSI